MDDDPEVLRAIERDLKKHYEERYRVLRAESGRAALDLLRRLQQRNDAVALLLVDHRMPEMNGVELLQEAIKLYPNAKRTLLTAYADTDAAIKAINDVQINHYLLKPWDPPEQELFPVLDDLLNDWAANFHPPFEGIRVLGTRWSSRSYEIRTFLARNQVPLPELAIGIRRVKGVKRLGRKMGNWLTRNQAQELVNAASKNSLRGWRDGAMLGLLLGCGLRRSEVVGLNLNQLQSREGRRVIVNLVGKGGRLRTVPMPSWCKELVDTWLRHSGVSDGKVFRRVLKGGILDGAGVTANVVWYAVKRCAGQAGINNLAPHDLRRHHRHLRWRDPGRS